MKTFTLHLDALIVIAVLFLASFGGNIFVYLKLQEIQRQNVDVRAGNLLYQMNTESLQTALDECQARVAGQAPIAADAAPTGANQTRQPLQPRSQSPDTPYATTP